MLKDYLKQKINSWYKNASIDYGVTGSFISAQVLFDDLYITWEENGEIRPSLQVAWYKDYTPEQIYDIWMEFAE